MVSFDDFWKLYPRRVAKHAAHKVWERINETDRSKAMEGLKRFVEVDWKGKDPTYIPYPATWLNAKRWEDGPVSSPATDLVLDGNFRTGIPKFEEPTEEERLYGIKVMRECLDRLTANNERLRLKAIAIRRKK